MRTEAGRSRGRPPQQRAPRVESVIRAARILKAIMLSSDGLRITDLSAQLGLHKSTVLRLLRSLAAEDIVRRDQRTARYRLNPALWLSASGDLTALLAWRSVVQEMLDGLSRATGATVVLALPDAGRRAMLKTIWAPSVHPLRVDLSLAPGLMPIHAVGAGLCYLACLPRGQLGRWLLGRLRRLTPKTTTSPACLRAAVARVRKQGYAVCRDQVILGVGELAVPVRDSHGAAAAALSLLVPVGEVTPPNLRKWLPLLQRAAAKLSEVVSRAMNRHADRQLGWEGP